MGSGSVAGSALAMAPGIIQVTAVDLITIFVGGSMLIEAVFDIQGFGLLQLTAIHGKDAYVILGTLLFASFLMVMGNILSDVIVALVDPRVKFQ